MSTTKKTIQLFWQHAWNYPRYVLGLLIVVPINILAQQFLPPLIAASVLDRLSSGDFENGELWASFGSELLWYSGLTLLSVVVFWRLIIFMVWKLESYVMRDLARTQFAHLMRLSAKFHSNSFGGSLVSQTNKLTGSYIRLADTFLFHSYPMLISFILTAVILWPRAPFFVLLLMGVSIVFMIVAVKITHVLRVLNAKEARAQNKQTGVLADAITNVMAVKSFATSDDENRRFDDATENTRNKAMDLMRASIVREAVFSGFNGTLDALALVLSVASVVLFDAEIGTVFLVLRYTTIITDRLWQFSQNTLRNINRALGDSRDGVKMLMLEEDVKDPEDPEMVTIHDGAIQFNAVDFQHSDSNSKDLLFEDLNIDIAAGEKIGLVGHSGSGKTTLTKILLRFSDINGGSIEIDGQDITKITQGDLRRNIAYVPQEPLLFHRTIAENISYGSDENVTEKDIVRAAKQANAHEFIKDLPDGYKTLVGERGVKLSGGQRQRVAIARAMIKDAPILVLDEATSALDSESEQLIQDALWKLMEGRTAIVIAHRLSTIQKMDRILVMEDGKIIEHGSHAELVKKKGKYAELWSHQSGGFLED